jgi:hypothetical protein
VIGGSGVAAAARRSAALDAGAAARVALLSAGLALAVVLRVRIAAGAGGTEGTADAAFALATVALSLLAGWWPRSEPRRLPAGLALTSGAARIGAGVTGAAFICAWPALQRLTGGPHLALVAAPGRGSAFAGFAAATLIVVTGEEVLLRGALWQACTAALRGGAGEWLAIGVGAVAFGLMHVPWYGWSAMPVDLAVGLWLGGLRLATRSVLAPWTAHAGADIATWWLL